MLAVRPRLRSCSGSTDLAMSLRARYGDRVQLAVLAGDSQSAADTAAALDLPVAITVPMDLPSSQVFADGIHGPVHLERRPLWKAVRRIARGLHRQARRPVGFDYEPDVEMREVGVE